MGTHVLYVATDQIDIWTSKQDSDWVDAVYQDMKPKGITIIACPCILAKSLTSVRKDGQKLDISSHFTSFWEIEM